MSVPAPAQDELYEEADDIVLDEDVEDDLHSVQTLDAAEEEKAAAAKVAATPEAAAVAAAATTVSRPAATNEPRQLEAAATITPLVTDGAEEEGAPEEEAPDTRACVHCGDPIGRPRNRGAETLTGPLHLGCVLAYKFLHQPRCAYCRVRFQDGEANSFVKDEQGGGALYHTSCFALKQAGQPFVKPTREGEVRKFAIARSRLSRKNWKRRYFVLSEANGGIFYYEDLNAKKEKAKGDKDKDKSGDHSSSGSDDDDDHQPQPPTTTTTTNNNNNNNNNNKNAAAPNLQQKIHKGTVPLKDQRNRLLSRPFFSKHRVDTNGDEQNAIGILFYDDAQSTQQRRLLFQCKDKEDYKAWLRALEAYIYTVDDPADYENEEAIAAETEAAKEKEKKDKKDKKKEEKKEKKEKKK